MTSRGESEAISSPEELLPIHKLSLREREVLAFLGQGLSRGEIAKILFRSPKTIDNHCTRIYLKLGVRSHAQLVNRMHRDSALLGTETVGPASDLCPLTAENEFLQRSLSRIESRLQAGPSERFYRAFLLALSDELGVDFAGICEADREAGEFIAIAVVADGQTVPQMASSFTECPCTEAMREGQLACPRAVRKAYPEDQVFEEFGIESYIGVRLDHHLLGQLGTLWVASRTPIENESEVLALLNATRRRIATELALLNAIERLDSLPDPVELPPI